MAKKTKQPFTATSDQNPEETPELKALADDVRGIFHQDIPLRSSFKEELNTRMKEEVEKKSGKSLSPERTHAGSRVGRVLKDFFRFPWPIWAYAAGGISVVLVLFISAGLLHGWKWDNIKGIVDVFHQKAVYADAEIILEKQGDTAEGVGIDGSFAIVSKKALNTGSVEDHLSIEPELPGDLTWSDGNTRATFVPSVHLQAGEVYKVTIKDGAKTEDGEEYGRDLKWAFQTIPTFTITGVTPADLSTSAPRQTTVEIEFNYRDLDAQSFAEFYSIEPQIGGRFETMGNKIVFLPEAPFTPETIYRVTVRAGFSNGQGQTISEDKAWEFQVQSDRYVSGNTMPWFDFSLSTGGVYTWVQHPDDEGKAQQTMMAYYSNLGSDTPVHFSVSQISMETLLRSQVWQQDRIRRVTMPGMDDLTLVSEWDQSVAGQAPLSSSYSRYVQPGSLTVEVPELEAGVYVVQMSVPGFGTDKFAFLLISDEVISYQKDGIGNIVLWTVDSTDRTSLPDREVQLYTLKDEAAVIRTVTTDGDGIARTEPAADLGAIVSGNSLILLYGYYDNDYYGSRSGAYKAVFALDRPLYKPGDEVFYKAVIRSDESGVYSVPPRGTTVTIRSSTYGRDGYEEIKTIDNEYGTVSGSFVLSDQIGYANVMAYVNIDGKEIQAGYEEFEVHYYRKPDYELTVSVDQDEVMAGTTVTATAKVQYYFGQPVAGQSISFAVYSNDYFEPDPADQVEPWMRSYWYGGSRTLVQSGTATLDDNGEFQFEVLTANTAGAPLSSPLGNSDPAAGRYSQKLSVEATYVDALEVQNVAGADVIVHRADSFLYREAQKYGYKVGDEIVFDLSLYDSMTAEPFASSRNFTATVVRHWSEIVGQTEHQTYDPATKTQRFWTSYQYAPRTETIRTDDRVSTDGQGKGTYRFTPSLPGSYDVVIRGQDVEGRAVPVLPYRTGGSYYVWVTDGDESQWWQSYSSITVRADQDSYQIGDRATITVDSTRAGGSAVVTWFKGAFIDSRTVDLSEGKAEFQIDITEDMIPNFMVRAQTPQNGSFAESSTTINVDTRYKKLTVQSTVEDKVYLPGEDVTVSLQVTDQDGAGVESEAVVYLVDKSLLALVDESSSTWYQQLYAPRQYYVDSRVSSEDKYAMSGGAEQGGCFAAGTLVQTPQGTRSIETINAGDEVLSYDVETGETTTNQVSNLLIHENYERDPLLSVNLADGSSIRVTSNHIVWSETTRTWKPMGTFVPGEEILLVPGAQSYPLAISSIREDGRGETVYNLALTGYPHTYLVGNGMLVHNEKGEGITRDVFKDSAAFEAHVLTGPDGTGQVTVSLPHNLTTWVVRAKAVTTDTRVGEGQAELVVSKHVIVRPSIPKFLIQGDSLEFTSVVHNYTGDRAGFNVTLEGEGFTVNSPSSQDIELDDGGQQEVTFAITVADAAEASFRIKAVTSDSSYLDEVVQTSPIEDQTVEQRTPLSFQLRAEEEATFSYMGAQDIRDGLQLSVSPTLASSLLYSYARIHGSYYGSTPELSEQLFTNLAFYEHYDALTMWQGKQDIKDAIIREVRSLGALYRRGQGWGYFDYDAVDTGLTTQACLAMEMARSIDADLDVASYSTDDCITLLPTKLTDYTISLDDKALILYTLTLAGRSDLVAAQALADLSNDMQSGSVSYLALALRELGDEERGRALLTGIAGRAQTEDELSYFNDTAQSYQHPQTKVAQTSLVLYVYSLFDMESDLSTRMARWLDQSRRSFSWYQVYDESQSIRGLLAYALVYDDLGSSYDVKVKLNGEEILSGKVEKGRMVEGSDRIEISPDKLIPGDNTLSVESTGQGQLYFTGDLTTWTSDIPESSRISLNRTFATLDGQEQTTFSRGDLVVMEFQYDGTELDGSEYSRSSYDLQGYIPAGFELIDYSFGTTSQADNQARNQLYRNVSDDHMIWAWSRNENDRVETSFSHAIPHTCKTYRVSYASLSSPVVTDGDPASCYPQIWRVLVRASFAGEFHARPTALFSQDIPSAYAYSTEQTVTIER